MPIKPRDKGWQATIHHKGKRWRKQFSNYAEAEQWEAQSKADVLAGRNPTVSNQKEEPTTPDKPQTLGALIDYTGRHEWADKKSGTHLLRNAQMVGELIGLDTDIKTIDAFMLDALVLQLQSLGNSNGTINRKLASLSKCLSVGVSLGLLDNKPRIRRMRESVNRIRWYSDEELKAMVSFCSYAGNPAFGHWLRFQADTGLRCAETRGITWEDIQNGVVVLSNTKSGEPRGVPLTKAATDAVEFNRHHEGGPFAWATASHIRQWWSRIRLHMDWDDKQSVPHALRHTFCSRLVQRGIPILTVKELAGHKRIEMTLRYAHLAPHNLVDAIKVLETTNA